MNEPRNLPSFNRGLDGEATSTPTFQAERTGVSNNVRSEAFGLPEHPDQDAPQGPNPNDEDSDVTDAAYFDELYASMDTPEEPVGGVTQEPLPTESVQDKVFLKLEERYPELYGVVTSTSASDALGNGRLPMPVYIALVNQFPADSSINLTTPMFGTIRGKVVSASSLNDAFQFLTIEVDLNGKKMTTKVLANKFFQLGFSIVAIDEDAPLADSYGQDHLFSRPIEDRELNLPIMSDSVEAPIVSEWRKILEVIQSAEKEDPEKAAMDCPLIPAYLSKLSDAVSAKAVFLVLNPGQLSSSTAVGCKEIDGVQVIELWSNDDESNTFIPLNTFFQGGYFLQLLADKFSSVHVAAGAEAGIPGSIAVEDDSPLGHLANNTGTLPTPAPGFTDGDLGVYDDDELFPVDDDLQFTEVDPDEGAPSPQIPNPGRTRTAPQTTLPEIRPPMGRGIQRPQLPGVLSSRTR